LAVEKAYDNVRWGFVEEVFKIDFEKAYDNVKQNKWGGAKWSTTSLREAE
jgi:hypothetical protein